ncbi:hypothetical protein, partial [uncultured Pedobacter sp.]|uniref:hypothetical protein n=1 Tax=uncultured Pedobacter sp. TaxID=246139 RepID=UPI0025F440A3
VLLKSGLTNFSDSTDQALLLALKEKFSAGIFCYFLMPKSKSPPAAVSRGKAVLYGIRNQLRHSY